MAHYTNCQHCDSGGCTGLCGLQQQRSLQFAPAQPFAQPVAPPNQGLHLPSDIRADVPALGLRAQNPKHEGDMSMASRPGRKRKQNVPRTKSGQISRAGKDPRMVALAQHHRAGKLSEWRGTTVGRLLEDDTTHTKGLSRDALHRAAVRLSEMHAAWQAAIASRRPMAVTSGGSNAPEDEERTARAIEAYTRLNTVLTRQGPAIRQATLTLVTEHHEENWQPPFWLAYNAVAGLRVLAEYFGLEAVGEDRRVA